MIENILKMLEYQRKEGDDVKEHIKLFIESDKFIVNNTVGYSNIIVKMMYERGKMYQLDSYPELKLSSYYNNNM